MTERKTERLVNLVLCLLATNRFLSVQEIRERVPGYDAANEEAFRRMFERDKAELRDIGVPLETGSDTGWDDDLGYRIERRDYPLPDISLAPDEAAAVALAGRLWQSAPLAGATASALLKLQAAGVEAPAGPTGLEPRIGVTEPAFQGCLQAVRDGRQVRFDYRAAGRSEIEERDVAPWGITSWHGRWYLVGHDNDREAPRVFRLSRVVGDVRPYGEAGAVARPADLVLHELVARSDAAAPTATAVIRVRTGCAWELRRVATATMPAADGWDEIAVGYSDPERLADRITAFGPDAVVEGPDEVRTAVITRLRALAGQVAS